MRALLALLTGIGLGSILDAQFAPTDLVCEWCPTPATIGDPYPEFAWEAPEQAKHQVVLGPDGASTWDSGWVESRVPVCEYAGPPLEAGKQCDWRVLAREFDNALVLVKPFPGGSFGEDTATSHELPAPMRPLGADGLLGEAVSTVTLRSGGAAILAE